MRRRERIHRSGDMGESQIEGSARDQLERRQLVGGGGVGAPEEAHYILDTGEAEKRCFDLARFGKELHRRGSDDAEGSLAADEELLQIVAGIVLAQAAQPVRGFCRSARPRCRRRWSTDCRRSDSSPRPRG